MWRSCRLVLVSILTNTGYSPEVKPCGPGPIVDRPAGFGTTRDGILIPQYENGDGDWLAPAKEQ